MNKKRNILIIIALLILSQWFMVRLVYAHKITGSPAKFLASVYKLKAAVIEDESGDINIYLKDFFENKDFASKLLESQVISNDQFPDLDISDREISEIVWGKLLKQAWLQKVAKENNIELNQDDLDYYVDIVGGQEKLDELLQTQGISLDEYNYFLMESDILGFKVYDYLIANFADQKGVAKIQEAYALLESENGENWDDVVLQYGEDSRLSDNSFWITEEEMVGGYEAIKDVEPGGFSKIVQAPMGYVIWHLDSISQEEDNKVREVRGLFVYAQGIDDFFDDYLSQVNVKRIYDKVN